MLRSESTIYEDAPFGLVIRTLREKKGWSAKRYADRTGYHDSYIRRVESGNRVPHDIRQFVDLIAPFNLTSEGKRLVAAAWMRSLGIEPF